MWGRFVDVFRRRRLDADLESQLAHHLTALEAEYRARGLAPGDARAAARRECLPRARHSLNRCESSAKSDWESTSTDLLRKSCRKSVEYLAAWTQISSAVAIPRSPTFLTSMQANRITPRAVGAFRRRDGAAARSRTSESAVRRNSSEP